MLTPRLKLTDVGVDDQQIALLGCAAPTLLGALLGLPVRRASAEQIAQRLREAQPGCAVPPKRGQR